MSNADLERALQIVAENPEDACFAGPCRAELLHQAEAAVMGTFPATYRTFLLKLGAGSFRAFETYGIVGESFMKAGVPNGVWLTLGERLESNLPDDLFIVGSSGDGNYYCVGMGRPRRSCGVVLAGSRSPRPAV